MSTQDRRTLRINITILEQRIVKMVEDRSAVRTGIDVARQRGRLADLDLLRRTYVQLSDRISTDQGTLTQLSYELRKGPQKQ